MTLLPYFELCITISSYSRSSPLTTVLATRLKTRVKALFSQADNPVGKTRLRAPCKLEGVFKGVEVVDSLFYSFILAGIAIVLGLNKTCLLLCSFLFCFGRLLLFTLKGSYLYLSYFS